MKHTPERHVVVGDQLHALSDDRLAFLLVVVVIHDIKHTVQEGNSWLDFIDDLQNLTPALGGILSLT